MNEANNYKFKTRIWNVVNDQSNENYNVGNEIIYNTGVLKSNLFDCNDAYVLVGGYITVKAAPTTKASFKNCVRFTECIIKVDGTTIDDPECLDLLIPMYNLIDYSSNYSETTGRLSFYSKDEATSFNADITNINNFKSFMHKAKLLGNTDAQLAPISNFQRSLELPLCNFKIKLKFK